MLETVIVQSPLAFVLVAAESHKVTAAIEVIPGLRTHLVAGIDDGIDRLRQQRRPIRLVDEFFDRMHLAARMDVGDALAQRFGLGLSERRAERLHLAIDVGLGDMVQIDQGQFGDAAARQCFGRP